MINEKNIVWHEQQVSKKERSAIKGQRACVLWFTGLSASGKSTIANALEVKLMEQNRHTYLLDGDNIRLGLNNDLGFSDEERVENIRRIGEVSKLFVDSGTIVLTAFISPFRKDREIVKRLVEKDEFIEVFVDTPLDICEKRDPKGLYLKAREGKIPNFTGVSSIYEAPLNAQIHLKTADKSVEECVDEVMSYLNDKGYI